MKKLFKSKNILILIGLLLVFTGCESKNETIGENTESWPKKPVEIVVPFNAGGDTDYNARTLGKYLEKELGQAFPVTNITGSGGTIAASQVKDSANDGYKILLTHVPLNISKAAGVVDFGYEDFEIGPIIGKNIGDVVVVRGDSPWDSMEDLIEDSKKNSGKYRIAANTGATTHWVAIGLSQAGAELSVVDSGAASDRIPALLGGHVDIICNSLSTVKDYVDSGEFKVLAIANSEKNEDYPEIPTLIESGVDVGFQAFYTLFFPKGTSQEIIDVVSNTAEKVINNNEEYASEIYTAYEQRPFYADKIVAQEHYKLELERLMEISDQLKGN